MEYVILILVVGVLGIWLGWKSHEHFMITVIKEHPEIMEAACKAARDDKFDPEISIIMDNGDTIVTDGVEIMVEKVNGMLYAYTKENNQFIAQGDTIESLLKSAHTRFPGKTFFGDLPE